MPDTEVIALCNQITRDYAAPDSEKRQVAIRYALPKVAKTQAVTLEGLRAKAKVYKLIPRDDIADSLADDLLALPV